MFLLKVLQKARSSILKGVTIGEGAIVGAGSVVTHDVPPFCVVAGNLAKVIISLYDTRAEFITRGEGKILVFSSIVA